MTKKTILEYKGVEFEFGGKTYIKCEVMFLDDKDNVPVIRLIDGMYLTTKHSCD